MPNVESKEKVDLTPAIERLRASKKRFDADSFARGAETGRTWAVSKAEAEELMRLQGLQDKLDISERAPSPDMVYFWMHPDHDEDDAAAKAFWEGVLGRYYKYLIDGEPYMSGFVNGALGVWDEVKNEL